MKNANKVNVNNLCENNSQINKVSKCLLSLVAVTAISFGSQAFGMNIPQAKKVDGVYNNYDNSESRLIIACEINDLDNVRLFLNNGDKKSVNIASFFNKTPLYWACYRNNPNMVRLLLENGAKESINKADNEDRTPLYWACYYNNTELVRLLLDNGAKEFINLADNNGFTIDEATDKTNGRTPLYWACYYDNQELVRLLLDNGAKESVNKTNNHFSPLYLACKKENLGIVKLLLDNGAKEFIDIVNNDYAITPLYLAICNNNAELVRLLLENCDKDCINKINTINKDGDLLLHEACGRNYLEIVRLLLRWGAKESINKVNKKGESPLYLACLRNNLKMVKLLVKRGVNKVDKEALDKAEENYENKKTQWIAIEILKELNPTKEYKVTYFNDKSKIKRSRSELENNENSCCGPLGQDLKRSKAEELPESKKLFTN